MWLSAKDPETAIQHDVSGDGRDLLRALKSCKSSFFLDVRIHRLNANKCRCHTALALTVCAGRAAAALASEASSRQPARSCITSSSGQDSTLPYIPRPSAYACDYHLTYQPRPPPSIPERDVGEFSRRGSKLMMCTIMRPDCAGICAILIVWLV